MDGQKRVIWVHVPSTGTTSWDAIVAGNSGQSPLYAEMTGLTRGQPGSMTGTRVKVVPDGGGHSLVAHGTVSEDYSICGREALAYAEVLDPQTLEWRRASFLQLSSSDVEHASSITATMPG